VRITVDGACLAAPLGGVARYLDGLLTGFREAPDPEIDLVLLRPESRVRTVAWTLWTLQRASAAATDVLHCPFYYPPLAPRCPAVTAIHDILVIERPEWFPSAWGRLTGRLIRRGARRSDAVVTASSHVADRIAERCRVSRERIHVIPYAVDHRLFAPPAAEEQRAVTRQLGLRAPYLVQLGAHEPRRGLDLVLQATAALRREIPDLEMVLVGEQRHDVPELDAPPPWVRHTGRLPDHQLPAVLSGALAVTAASRDEGFDLPLLEAMASGGAVVASDIPVHVEHFTPGVRLFSSGDADDLAAAVLAVADPSTAAALRRAGVAHAQGFRWTDVARQHARVWREVAG
jgi:glycosyltransferase involved in cell wall biosynthesis